MRSPSCGERKRIDAMWRAHLHSRAGSGEPSVPSSYFTAYASGKSAIRLALPRTQRLAVPFDVHKFLVPAGDGLWRAPTTLTCAEALELADAPVVLHYANAGFAHWRRKYEILGRFGDKWWGRVPCRIPAHLHARDICGSQDDEGAREFYRTWIMREGGGERELLRAHGLLVRIDFVADVLARLDRRRQAQGQLRWSGSMLA